jgi:YidC/Oxa1 family membrane protein insertase
MSELWQALLEGLASILIWLHNITEPLFGVYSWGWSIVLLTLVVRTLLLPLAIKQTTSMRAMQALQPEMKRIQSKYKADRGMMRTDPQRFQELRGKQQEELQKLYSERGINPAAGCLPLVAQMPVFFALFSVLRSESYVPPDAPFYLIDRLSLAATGGAGIGAYLLLGLMGVTTFVSQRQMMASNPAIKDQPQQRVLLYAMPVMLTVFGINFPAGVLLYWVTTNLWTMVQQRIMFRTLGTAGEEASTPAVSPASALAPRRARRADTTEPTEVTSGEKDPSAPKGAPTPKQRDAVRNRAATNSGSGSGRGGKSKTGGSGRNGRKSKGSSAASAKQRRT